MYYYQSIENGESWELLKIDELKRDESNKIIYFAPRPQDIEIIDEVIYVALDSGRIDKSTDLGKNWERIDLEYKHSISTIKMETKDVGIALIKDFETIPNGGGRLDYDSLLVTTDGWKTWNSIKLPNYIKKEGSGWLNNLIYSEGAIGISGPYHNMEDPGIGLYITTNNGEDWIHSKKDQLMKENALNNNNLWGVSGADYDNKFRKIIKKSTDFGKNWDTLFVDNKTESSVIGAGIIEFADDKHAFMINGLNEIWESSDAGNTWIKYDIEWEGEISKNGTRVIDYKVLDKNKIILIGTHYLFIYDNSTSSIINNALKTIVNVFPNPAQNFLNISFQSQIEQITKVEIYNINGERKYVSNNINNLNQIKINVQDFDKCSYFFKLYSINDELVSFGKFVKN